MRRAPIGAAILLALSLGGGWRPGRALALSAGGGWRPVQAQVVVIDPGAIAQLVLEVQQLEQALQVAQRTLAQAQQAYAASTGDRGMENLLAGIIRNYLAS